MSNFYPSNFNAELRRIIVIAKEHHSDESEAKREIKEAARKHLRVILADAYLDRIFKEYV